MTRKRYDENDPEQREQRQKGQQLRREQAEADIRWVLSQPQGRRVIVEILRMTGLMEPCHTRSDALQTAYRCGAREIGLQLQFSLSIAAQETIPALLAELVKPPDAGRD